MQSINIRNVRKKRHSIFKFDGLRDQKGKKKRNSRHPVYTISFLHTAGTCFPLEIQPISRAEGGKDLIQAQAHVQYRTMYMLSTEPRVEAVNLTLMFYFLYIVDYRD